MSLLFTMLLLFLLFWCFFIIEENVSDKPKGREFLTGRGDYIIRIISKVRLIYLTVRNSKPGAKLFEVLTDRGNYIIFMS